jgi:hypothetical protein
MKSVTTLESHDVDAKYALLPRFQIDVCCLVKIQFDRRIDVPIKLMSDLKKKF